LGTPEWDRLSEAERGRPQSYSPFNPLNPNFAKIHQKIQRRHTLKETKVNEWTNNKLKSNSGSLNHENDDVDKEQYTKAWNEQVNGNASDKKGISTNGVPQDTEDIQSSNSSKIERVILEKPPIPKKKSLFQELLDASAKENERMNRIKEGLHFYDSQHKVVRHQSMKPYRLAKMDHNTDDTQIRKPEIYGSADSNIIPDIISEMNEKAKPGILKHGVRMRENKILKLTTKKDFNTKHHLIHQEDLPLFGDESRTNGNTSIDEVRVSVYADTPFDRLGDMMFVPLSSGKPKDKHKKVNFHEHVDIKERTALSELVEENAETLESKEEFSNNSSNNTSEINENTVVCDRLKNSANIKRRTNVKYKNGQKLHIRRTNSIKQNHESTLGKDAIVPHYKRTGRVSYPDIEDKQDYIDSILLSSKPIGQKNKDLRSDPAWKHAKPAVSEVLVHDSDPVEAIALANITIEQTPLVQNKNGNSNERSDSRTVAHLPVLNFPEFISQFQNEIYPKTPPRSPLRSPPRSPPRSPHGSPSKSPDLDSMAELTSLLAGDFDLDDLSEEIDRSMLGEDLIKAYRFWDRKKKAFPGGLRKIEAPSDRNDSLYPKQYGGVKTYKITNPKTDKPPLPPASNKSPLQSVLTEWV
jgi:hypothetical protein